MNPLTKGWLIKAERDYSTMLRESRVDQDRNNDAIAFHAQQCAEKYLKGYLQERDIVFPKSHNLVLLFELLLPVQNEMKAVFEDCEFLSEYAVSYRYPGEDIPIEDAEQAITSCKRIRKLIRDLLSPTDQLSL